MNALWVNDHPKNNKAEVNHLKKAGITCVEVKNTRDAIQHLKNPNTSFKCVVSDWNRDGDPDDRSTLIRSVRDIQKDIPIIIYTSGDHVNGLRGDRLFQDRITHVTNKTGRLLEQLSVHFFGDPEPLLRKDPGKEDSPLLYGRMSRYVYEDQAFFRDEGVHQRMNSIRSTIEFVRQYWDHREELLAKILCYPTGIPTGERESLIEYAIRLTEDDYDWHDQARSPGETDTIVLSDYTSRFWYDTVFGIMNKVFRSSDERVTFGDITLCTYILENINVSLYNYVKANGVGDSPYAKMHQGLSYRGLSIDSEQLEDLKELTPRFQSLNSDSSEKAPSRQFTHPLSLISSSNEIAVAEEFLHDADEADQEEESSPTSARTTSPVLFKQYIFSLPPEYLDIYHAEYPGSVVSSICAVDVHERSHYPEEHEVLLRGPFFEMLDYHDESPDLSNGTGLPQFNAMIIDANRDHKSTFELKKSDPETDDSARHLFRYLITIWRAKLCIHYHNDFSGLPGKDIVADQYAKSVKDSFSKIEDKHSKDVRSRVEAAADAVEVPDEAFAE